MSERKLLLHCCCGPCSTACVERLRSEGIEPVLFYCNDNILDIGEWEKRLENLVKFAEAQKLRVEISPYDHEAWLNDVAGLENEPEGGTRCAACFRHSLRIAAEFAAGNGFAQFTTSLSVSPHKRSSMLFEAGTECADAVPQIQFAPYDFKKKNGYQRSVQLASEYELYRQQFCGCEFSIRAQ